MVSCWSESLIRSWPSQSESWLEADGAKRRDCLQMCGQARGHSGGEACRNYHPGGGAVLLKHSRCQGFRRGAPAGGANVKGTQPTPRVHPGEEWGDGEETPQISLPYPSNLGQSLSWPHLIRSQNVRKPEPEWFIVQKGISGGTEQDGEVPNGFTRANRVWPTHNLDFFWLECFIGHAVNFKVYQKRRSTVLSCLTVSKAKLHQIKWWQPDLTTQT